MCDGHFLAKLFSWPITRAGEPGRSTCAHGLERPGYPSSRSMKQRCSHAPASVGMTGQAGFTSSGHRHPSTKTPFETHTGGCRVRRKRKRLTSNGSIESDLAIRPLHSRGVSRRVTSDRVLTFLILKRLCFERKQNPCVDVKAVKSKTHTETAETLPVPQWVNNDCSWEPYIVDWLCRLTRRRRPQKAMACATFACKIGPEISSGNVT